MAIIDKKKAGTVGGAIAGGAVGGPALGAATAIAGGQKGSGKDWSEIGDKIGVGPNAKAHDNESKAQAAIEASYGAGVAANQDITGHEEDFYGRQTGRDDRMLGKSQGYANELVRDTRLLQSEANQQAKDAGTTYSNDILPRYKGLMERSYNDSQNAMTLAQAGDPNNQVQQAVRKLYQDQAAGVGKQGLADAGVLAALGAQASAGQFGGTPMTGGQMAAIQGQNMAQSGMAYSRAQQQMQNLREQGLNRGFEESDRQYGRGQQALDRASGDIANYEGANQRNWGTQRDFRQERGGLSDKVFGARQGQNMLEYGTRTGTDQMGLQMDTAQANRTLANEQGRYGSAGALAQGNMAAAQANQVGKIGLMGSLAGAGIGAMAGGAKAAPAGAQLGETAAVQAAGGAPGGATPTPGVATPPPQASAYGGGSNVAYSPGAYGGGGGPGAAYNYDPYYAQRGGRQGTYPV